MLQAIIDQAFQDQRGRYYFLFDCAEYGDKLKVLKFSLEEHVSKPFKLKLQLTTREKVDPRKLNDRSARLTILDKHQPEKRHYCGIVSKAVQKDKGFDNGFTRFNVTIRPELHFAKMIHDNRIYQQQTIPQIVEQVLKESGVSRFRWHLLEPHEQREYVVQYKRSNLQFIERLLASEGISYRFDHTADGCELVMFDKSIEAEKCTSAEELEYNATAGSEVRGQTIKRFAWAESVRPNVATFREQHFKNPAVLYTQQWGSDAGNGQQRVLEKYSFPGYYKSDEAGKRAARYESDSLLADASEGSGMGHAQFLSAGRKFKMTGHDEDRYNKDYFLVSVSQQGRQPNVEEEFASDEDSTFLKTEFTCVRHTTPWRPRRPEAQQTDGDHLATVVGPEGEEIYCDEFGRVKIFYHWDRKGKKDDTASCWVRVSQNWAGSQYGGIMIPRIGQSVVVSYINGDIEQPLVSGRIFNSVEQVPHKLPDNKTKMVIKSQTHKGDGFNSLEMEDEKGREEVFIRAENDMNTYVKNHKVDLIEGNHSIQINKKQITTVGSGSLCNIHGGYTINVGFGDNSLVSDIGNLNNYNLLKKYSYLESTDRAIGGETSGFNVSSFGPMSLWSSSSIGLSTSGTLYNMASNNITLDSKRSINIWSKICAAITSGDMLKLISSRITASCGNTFVNLDDDGNLKLKALKLYIDADEIYINGRDFLSFKSRKINLN